MPEAEGREGVVAKTARMVGKVASQAWRLVLAGLVLAAVTYASYKRGVPASGLPGAALGWRFLFHLERASVVLATAGIVLLVVWRALHGEFPIKFGNVEYAAKDAAAVLGGLT
jgi:hypothetical protein